VQTLQLNTQVTWHISFIIRVEKEDYKGTCILFIPCFPTFFHFAISTSCHILNGVHYVDVTSCYMNPVYWQACVNPTLARNLWIEIKLHKQ